MNIGQKARKFIKDLGDFLEKKAISTDVKNNPPTELHLELTYKCDSKCIICNLKYLEEKQTKKDLSIKEIKKMVMNSELLKNLEFIILSGGEPWLADDLLEIIHFFHTRYPKAEILILSNLFNTDLILSKIEQIKSDLGLDRISLGSSLDGLEHVHDYIRGANGAFRSLITTTLLIKKKYPDLLPCFNFTLNPKNSHQLFEVFKWARKMGFNVSYQMMVQKKETRQFRWNKVDPENIDKDINKIIEFIWHENKWNRFAPSLLFENPDILFFLLNFHYMHEYLSKPRRFFPSCFCGEKYAMIDPVGNLYFCPVYKDLSTGNVREKNFDILWRNEKSGEIRSFFNTKICQCWLSCTNNSMMTNAFFSNKDEILDRFNTKEL